MISGYNENMMTGWKNYFSSMDIHFGNFMVSFVEKKKDELFLAAALVSRYTRDGHICLDLNSLAGKVIFKSEDGKTTYHKRTYLYGNYPRTSRCGYMVK